MTITPNPIELEDNLPSERNVDYMHLEKLLNEGRWKDADQETSKQILNALNQESWSKVDSRDLLSVPCQVLESLDRLWAEYSNGKWGFSAQKRIWQKCSSPTTYNNDWKQFGDRVGWRKMGNWLNYDDLTFDLKKSLPGELPSLGGMWGGGWGGGGAVLLSCKTCRL